MFVPDKPLLEIFLRGSIVYLGIFFLLRLVLKRQTGGMSTSDLLVTVLIADAAQNAMAADYNSVPDGLWLVATIIFWCYALDWLSYRSERVARLLEPAPLKLIRDGCILERNMRREEVTHDDLKRHLRLNGIEEISQVKSACMESDGRISVIKREGEASSAPSKPGV